MEKIIKALKDKWSSLRIGLPMENKAVVPYETIDWLEFWLTQRLKDFEQMTKEEFLKKILPKKKNSQDWLKLVKEEGFNECLLEIINNASLEEFDRMAV